MAEVDVPFIGQRQVSVMVLVGKLNDGQLLFPAENMEHGADQVPGAFIPVVGIMPLPPSHCLYESRGIFLSSSPPFPVIN